MAESAGDFKTVILNILNRWTGLKMVVDHQMGGRQSGEKALYMVDYIAHVFQSNRVVEEEDLEDLLVEYMDTEFNTVLEDDSPIEVSRALVRLFGIFSERGMSAVEAELRTLPPVSEWLDIVQPVAAANYSSSSESSDDNMDEDSEWTTVRYGRRKN